MVSNQGEMGQKFEGFNVPKVGPSVGDERCVRLWSRKLN